MSLASLDRESMDVTVMGELEWGVQQILLNLAKGRLTFIYPFYLHILLQELEQGIACGGQLCYEASYIINPS